MSGGSFNYLYCRDVGDLLNATDDLEAMIKTLELWAPNTRALHEAQRLLIDIHETRRKLDQAFNSSLGKIFHAVEWATDGDYSKEQAMDLIRGYDNGEDV